MGNIELINLEEEKDEIKELVKFIFKVVLNTPM